jgi:glycosyltransferase involved in cell wall biosynthesis
MRSRTAVTTEAVETEPHGARITAVPGRTSSIRVLLVTGAYYPEISAAGVQCRAVAAALRGLVDFSVVTTAVDPALPATEIVDGVTVHRVAIDRRHPLSKVRASVRLATSLWHAGRACDVVHIHGVSQKNLPAAVVARWLGKPLVLTLHTSGQDEPDAVRRRGRLAYWAFMSPSLVLAVSPSLSDRYHEAAGAARVVMLTPNGIDTQRFRPASEAERLTLRRGLGWPDTQPVVLFVGFFSRDKRPDLLFRAWRRLAPTPIGTRLVYVGATGSGYYEIDRSLSGQIRRDADACGRGGDVEFAQPTNDIERYFRAADIFVLPSAREAHPLALLEAMACGLPAIATHLPGATDAIIEEGINGRLVPVDDEPALADALGGLLADRAAAQAMGARARETVLARYDVGRTSEKWLAAYHTVLTKAQ